MASQDASSVWRDRILYPNQSSIERERSHHDGDELIKLRKYLPDFRRKYTMRGRSRQEKKVASLSTPYQSSRIGSIHAQNTQSSDSFTPLPSSPSLRYSQEESQEANDTAVSIYQSSAENIVKAFCFMQRDQWELTRSQKVAIAASTIGAMASTLIYKNGWLLTTEATVAVAGGVKYYNSLCQSIRLRSERDLVKNVKM